MNKQLKEAILMAEKERIRMAAILKQEATPEREHRLRESFTTLSYLMNKIADAAGNTK